MILVRQYATKEEELSARAFLVARGTNWVKVSILANILIKLLEEKNVPSNYDSQ